MCVGGHTTLVMEYLEIISLQEGYHGERFNHWLHMHCLSPGAAHFSFASELYYLEGARAGME